jgi:hypothetical protein
VRARGDEAPAGGRRHLAVELDAGDLALRPHEAGEEGGVVARAGADLEHPVPVVDVEHAEHLRHDRRLRRRGRRHPVRVAAGHDGLVAVDGGEALPTGVLGEEGLAGHGGEGLGDRPLGQVAVPPEVAHQVPAQGGAVVLHRADRRRRPPTGPGSEVTSPAGRPWGAGPGAVARGATVRTWPSPS